MTEAADALQRALRAGFAGLATVEELESRSWASITFSGERHRVRLRFEGEGAAAADDCLDGLAEREFDLPGHVLADIALVSDEREGTLVRLTLEALTVEES